MKPRIHSLIPPSVIAASILAAFGSAMAAETDEEVARLTTPDSSVNAGIGVLTNDGARFGQYSGVRKDGAYGLLDLDLIRRDDGTGTWMRLHGRNLGLDSRELRFEHERQGNWGYFIDFSQTPRYNPYTVNTALQGIGGNSLRIPYPAATSAKSDTQLKAQRDALTLGLNKILAGGWDLQLRFRNEEKNGARMFSRGQTGGAGAGGFEFLAEPIDYTTRQLEATAGYTGEKLQLSGGYYGTWFTNRNQYLNIVNQPFGPTSLGTGAGAFTPIGLPPGNESHQLHLAGGYSFTPATRGNFKLAYARAAQEEAFPFAPAALPGATSLSPFVGRNNLGGRIDTTQAQFGLSARPLPKLALRADLRYENRADKTPILPYMTTTTGALITAANSPTSTIDGNNEPRSIKTTVGKAEASYSLPMGFRITGGVDYEQKKRNTSPVRVVSHRYETEETSYRAELRRAIGETATGSLAYVNSRRTGSEWLVTTTLNGAAGSNLIAPLHLADRDRDKWRAVLDWSPMEKLSLQFAADDSGDTYSGRALGPRKGKAQLYSADATYTFSENWQATGWISRSDTRAEQVTCEVATGVGVCPSTAADPIWQAKLRNAGDALGLGLRGKPSGALELGADLQYSKDRAEFRQAPLPVPAVAGVPLPDVNYDRLTLRLFAKYALQKNAGVRLNFVFDRFSTDDFNWASWQYTDGTRVMQAPTQKTSFIGASYYYEFR